MKIAISSNELFSPRADCLSAFIHSIPVFSNFNETEINEVKKLLCRKKFKKGQLIFAEGDTDTPLYLLESGRVRIFKSSADGKEQVLWVIKPNNIFGLMALFSDQTPAIAVAVEDAMTYAIQRRDVYSLINVCPKVAINMLTQLSRQIVNFASIIEGLSFKDVSTRLAKLILDNRHENTDGQQICKLTQKEMACMVGTAREVICRRLKEFESKGIIKVRYNHILIENPDKLYELV
ncbi:MAG: Crp/Fnr family transcriptional regulator [Nitrospirae bacterium]|nr:Crp/Fnr family transcriptional regulator [Nitrospirota bacterium]